MKNCTGCGEPKAFDQFHKDAQKKDGLHSRCKVCRNADVRTVRASNPEKGRIYNRARYAANIDKKRATKRKWRAANPTLNQLASLRRRARKQENGIFVVTPKDVRRLKAEPCYLCLIAPSTALDHIIPVSRGGRHSRGNLLGVCESCNNGKRSMYIVEYRRYLRRLPKAA